MIPMPEAPWHCHAVEFCKNGGVLYVGSEDDRMLSQVQDEGITAPAAHGLHSLEGNTPEEIFKHSPNVYAMASQVPKVERLSYIVQAFGKGGFV